MPGFILHLGATVLCAHAGQGLPTVTSPRVTVGGQPASLMAPYTIAGCTFPPPPSGNGPCVLANWITMSTRVFVTGTPVLLFDSQAICAPTGTPVTVVQAQVRVKGT